jgi:hypothetical protein
MMVVAERPGADLAPIQRRDLVQLPERDRALLTPDVIERWTRDLGPDDAIDPAEIARLERGRLRNLQTIRQGAELNDLEFKLLRYLQRAGGKVRTYVQIAHHLWGSTRHPIRGYDLRSQDGYASPYVRHIWTLVAEIRRKLEIDPARPQHLALRRGVGYSWHDDPPALNDGLDYAALGQEVDRLRIEVRYELGGEIGSMPIPRQALHPMMGPNHPDYPGEIEVEITGRSSERA